MAAKGKGKAGKSASKAKAKRHDKASSDKRESTTITKGALRRLARRGGVKRIGMSAYDEVRDFADIFLENVVRCAVVMSENARRKTINQKIKRLVHHLTTQSKSLLN